MKIKDALSNENISWTAFFNALSHAEYGDWDSVNDTDIIREYISEKMSEGIHVSHILEAIENEYSEYDLWSIWLGNSMETPSPINTKEDLIEALGLSDEDLDIEIEL
ncbi:MAG: hypothetical protein IJ086_15840 [Clostridium sp.]|nr:hypothetical protein [Clostridium sp.]MBQ9000146.1 hypothetical protein [Clostridium sp.]